MRWPHGRRPAPEVAENNPTTGTPAESATCPRCQQELRREDDVRMTIEGTWVHMSCRPT